MHPSCYFLFPGERAALVDALRRDSEREREKADLHPEWAEYHLYNVRLNTRIIEAFGQRLERV